ncbi:MAG: transglycosylase domain-containing protein, partial [Myxococcales bacterium]|nr:transglycosylase domain-containing protein [Myxococcales bacterium]
ASTITMQVTRNILLWPGRNIFRKGLELLYAPLVDLLWGKDRVLEVYLNIAEWGPGIYGINAAANAWFGHDIDRLYPDEIARLFVILPSPLRWDPRAEDGPERRRYDRVRRAMRRVRIGKGWAVCP